MFEPKEKKDIENKIVTITINPLQQKQNIGTFLPAFNLAGPAGPCGYTDYHIPSTLHCIS